MRERERMCELIKQIVVTFEQMVSRSPRHDLVHWRDAKHGSEIMDLCTRSPQLRGKKEEEEEEEKNVSV